MDLYLTLGAPEIGLVDIRGIWASTTKRSPMPFETFPLSLPRPGLGLADLALRAYRDGVPYPALPPAAVLASLGGTDYRLTVPTSPGARWGLTWEVDGQGGAHEWPMREPPPFFLIPDRETGLDASAFSLRAFRAGVPASFPMSFLAREIGSPGDYLVTGAWPRYDGGARWTVFYDIDGVTYGREWGTLTAQPAAGEAMGGLGQLWRELAPQVLRTLGDRAESPGRAETVIIRRASTLQDAGGDARISRLKVLADAPVGATTLLFGLPSGNGMTGTLQAGASVSLGVDTFVLSAEAVPSGATLTVQLVSSLAAPLTTGALLDLQAEAVITYLNCQVSRKVARPFPGMAQFQAVYQATVTIPVLGNPIPPLLNDGVELEDGTRGPVVNVPGDTGAFWKLRIG